MKEWELSDEEIEEIRELDDSDCCDNFEEFWMHRDTLNRIGKAHQKKLVEHINRNLKGYEDRTVGLLLNSTFWLEICKSVGLK